MTTTNIGNPEDRPIPDTFVMDQSQDILARKETFELEPQRQERAPIRGDTKHAKEFNEALKYSPSMRRDWTPEPEWTSGNTFGQAVWNSMKRDSFIGNSGRLLDQKIAETQRNSVDENLIWDSREALLDGISPQYHAEILNAPTFGLARRESSRVRSREQAIKREHNTHMGKTLAADIAGFILDPTNLLPGYGILKGIALAKRTSSLSVLQGIAASSKGRQMADFAAIGAFEEAIRMAPRYASDPTFEVNEYMEGIAMSAAFSGLLPIAFSGIRGGINKLPALHDDIQKHLHTWGMDVGVRQAMRFPGQLKETGFKDPGTALRKAKEIAQDAVNKKVKEFNKTTERRKVNDAIREDFKGETPTNNKFMEWAESKLDTVGDVAIKRSKLKVKILAQATAATTVGGVVAGPVGAIAAAALFSNRDYIALGARLALRKRKQRRIAYNAAVAAGDDTAAAAILRSAKTKPTVADTVEELNTAILQSVDRAKTKLRELNEKAKVCS